MSLAALCTDDKSAKSSSCTRTLGWHQVGREDLARSPSAVLRQASTIFIPERASASTLGTPIPLAPPVTTATPPSGTYGASISALLISRSTSLAVDFLPRSRSAAATAAATVEKELATSVAMPRSRPSVRSGCEFFMIRMYGCGCMYVISTSSFVSTRSSSSSEQAIFCSFLCRVFPVRRVRPASC